MVSLIRTPVEVKWTTGLRGVYGHQPSLVTITSNNSNGLKREDKNGHNKTNGVKVEEDTKVDLLAGNAVLDTMYYPPPITGGVDVREIKKMKQIIGEWLFQFFPLLFDEILNILKKIESHSSSG